MLAINAAILVLYAWTGLHTKLWKCLAEFDYTDIKCALVGGSAGAEELASRAGKWDGDPADERVGGIRVDIRYNETIREMDIAWGGQVVKGMNGKTYTIIDKKKVK